MPTARRLACLVLVFLSLRSFAQTADSILLKKLDSLIQVSRALTNQKDFDGALRVHAAADSLALACCGPESAAYGSIYYNQGRIFYYKRAYADAERCYLLAKDIRAKTVGTNHLDYELVITNLAQLYMEMGKYAQSETCWKEVIAVRATLFGKDHAEYAFAVNQLALCYTELAQFEKAEPLFRDLASTWAAKNGRENADYAVFVNNWGLLYLKSGRLPEAESLLREAMLIREKILGKEHPDYASSLNNLANLYYYQGYYERAEPLCIAAKDIREKVYGKSSTRYAWSVNNLANLYTQMGRFDKADPLLAEALQIKAQVIGKQHPDYANTLNNQGIVYLKVGNFDKAQKLFQESRSIRASQLGKEHPSYASSVKNLATAYYSLGLLDTAEILLREALSISEKVLGATHPEVISSYVDLASVYMKKDDLNRAEALLTSAMEKLQTISDTSSETYTLSLINFGTIYQKKGAYDDAQTYFKRAVSALKPNLGEQEQCTRVLFDLSANGWARNDMAACERYLTEGLDMQKKTYTRSARHLSEEELSAYAAQSAYQSDYTLSLSEVAPAAAAYAYDDVLFHKGFLLNVVTQTSHEARIHAEVADLYEEMKGYHRRLAVEYAKPPAAQQNVSMLEEEANKLEKELSQRVSGIGRAFTQVSWKMVQAQLQPGEACIEFVYYQHNPSASSPSDGTWMYGALVLLPQSTTPVFIKLCPAGALEQLMSTNGRTQPALIQALYGTPALYRLLWQPLENVLPGVKKVYFSPAGLLHQINLEALPTNDAGTLADHFQFVRLRSTRQLAVGEASIETTDKDAVLLGGIQYDTENNAAPAPASGNKDDKRSGTWSTDEQDPSKRIEKWPYLKWTKVEVSGATNVLTAAGWKPAMWTDTTASEIRFKSLGQSAAAPRIVHMATHGFFFSQPASKNLENTLAFQYSQHPMIRAGLILSGANYAWKYGHPMRSDMEDGILTAYEISQMNFQHTELVILSACETGLGDIRGNEGVYGLQRAFKIAGAQNIIMSLWQVPDFQTQEFMNDFYVEWLESHRSLPEAFYSARKKMRARYPDPFYWAGLILMQ